MCIGFAGNNCLAKLAKTTLASTLSETVRAKSFFPEAFFLSDEQSQGHGHLGTMTSSARFKDEIKPMGNASEAILALKPVSFRYKKEIDSQGIPEFGLVAEEVEKINPDLIIRDPEGKPYTVRYEAINAMLLNEFLKEHRKVAEQGRKVQEQEATITKLESTVAQQQ